MIIGWGKVEQYSFRRGDVFARLTSIPELDASSEFKPLSYK